MPLPVNTLHDLQAYLRGVAERAEHHAGAVQLTALLLVGIVTLLHDPNEGISVHRGKDGPANVLWFHANGQRFALSYDHQRVKIVLRSGSTHGADLAVFDDMDPSSHVLERMQTAVRST